AAFGLEAIQIYGTVPRQNIEVSTMTGGDCLGEISYLNRRVPIMDATRVLGLGDRLRRTQPEIVVVNFPDGHLLGLAVDVIQQIRMIRNAELVEVNGLLAEAGSLFSYVLTRASGGQVFILNPERLVQQEALLKMSTLSDKPKAKAQVKAEESAAMVAGTNDVVRTQQRCLVFTGGLRVCAKITDVVSILPMPETLTPYVGPSPAILGLFPFEKRAVPLVSMALSLGRPKSEPGVMNRVLLVGEPDSRVGFMVDVVDGIETSEYIAAADQKSTISTRVAKLRNKEIKGLLPFLDLEQRARSLSTHSLEPH
ncbi:MAG: chemotaxis protein CheW, partial [Pseudomonadota bacterium]